MSSPNIEGSQNAQVVQGGVFGAVIMGVETPAIVQGDLTVTGNLVILGAGGLQSALPDITTTGTTANGYSLESLVSSLTGVPNASVALKTTRGTTLAPTATQAGDVIGNMDYFGFGTIPAYSASLDAVATGVFTATSWPSQFNFNLTPVNAITPAQAGSLTGAGIFTLPLATSSLHVNGVDANSYAMSAVTYNNNVLGTGIQLGGGRGTAAAPTPTLAGDILGNIDFSGQNTATVQTEGAAIDAVAGSLWSATNSETYLSAWTTPANSIVSVEKMRLASNGALLVGTTNAGFQSGQTTFATTTTGDVIIAGGGVLSLGTESAGAYNFQGLGYSTANTNNASIGLKSQTRGAAATSFGDTIGNVDFFGYTGVGYGYAAAIDCTANATWTTISTPTQFNINLTAPGSVTPTQAMSLNPYGQISLPQAGGIIGSNGTYSSAAGIIGEYVTAQVLTSAPVSLTTATTANITSISLTAGDWDVEGIIDYIPAATTSLALLNSGTSVASATMGAQDTYSGDFYGAVIGAVIVGEIVPKTRLLLTATTTVYLVAMATFTTSTLTAAGRIMARRMR